MHKSRQVVCSIVIISLLSFWGCGKKSTDNDIDTEALAEAVQAETAMMVNNLCYFFDDGLYYLNNGVGALPRPADTSYCTYDSATFWWTYILQLDTSDPWIMQINQLDSIRFTNGNTFQDQPDDSTDRMELRIVGDQYLQFHPDSVMTADYDIDCEYGSANTDTININGDFQYGMDLTMGSFEFIYSFVGSYDSIRYLNDIYNPDNYPISGRLDLTIDISSSGDPSQEIPAGNYDAVINLVFTGSGYHGEMTIEGDHYTWDETWGNIARSSFYVRGLAFSN
jgi:hypothetical protein